MNTVEKLPHWLRWILVPLSAVLALIIVNTIARIFFWIQSRFLGLGEGAWLELIWRHILTGSLTGFSVIYISALVAPAGKKVTSLVIGALFVMIASVSILAALEKKDFWAAVELVCTITGLGIGIYTVFEQEQTYRSRIVGNN
jgi:hypothetical protein